jgi:hypothetical protein
MNIKQMAAVNVAKIVGFAVAVGIVFNLGLHYFGLAVMGILFAAALFAYMIKFAYDIELSKLESKNALNKLKETK